MLIRTKLFYLANLMVDKSERVFRYLIPSGENGCLRGTAVELGDKICDAIHAPHTWSIRRVDSMKSHCTNKETG